MWWKTQGSTEKRFLIKYQSSDIIPESQCSNQANVSLSMRIEAVLSCIRSGRKCTI